MKAHPNTYIYIHDMKARPNTHIHDMEAHPNTHIHDMKAHPNTRIHYMKAHFSGMVNSFKFLYPPQRSCRGVYWFHHVRPSVDKSYVV